MCLCRLGNGSLSSRQPGLWTCWPRLLCLASSNSFMLNWVFYRVLGGVLYRDMFYELIRDWEDHHLTAGWSVRHCQSEKIRSLINVGRDSLANCLHLARLFVLQLIQVACSCIILGRLLSVCKQSNSLSEHTQTHNSVCITIPESMLCEVLPLSHHFYRASIFYTLSLIHIWRCRRIERCRSRWSPYH